MEKLRKAKSSIDRNLIFVEAQFNRHIEKTASKAKVDLSAWVTSTVQQADLFDQCLLVGDSDNLTKANRHRFDAAPRRLQLLRSA